MNLDLAIFNVVHSASGAFKLLDWFGIFAAKYLPYLILAGFLYLVLREKLFSKKLYFILLTALSALLARGVVTETIRFFYDRPRPFEALGFEALINHSASGSFPSGHAAFYFALAMIVYYINRQLFKYFLSAAVLMGIARVFVGVHWPLDVVAGTVIAIASVFVIKYFLPKT